MRAYYRRLVCRAIPRLAVLDDRDVDPELDRMEIPEGLEDRMIGEEEAGEGGGEGDGTIGARATAGARKSAAAAVHASAARGSGVAGVAALRKGGAASGGSLAATPLDTSVELALVTEGIKYAAVGIDDPDAVMVRDEVTGDLSIELAEDFLGPSLPGSLDVSLDPGASADAITVAIAVAIAFGVRVGLHPSWLVQKRSPRALRPFRRLIMELSFSYRIIQPTIAMKLLRRQVGASTLILD